MSTKKEYPYELDIKSKKFNFRKWKVKDKKEFLKNLNDDPESAVRNLVYNTIDDKKITLDSEEFKYTLVKLRAKSLGEFLTYNFQCDSCNEEYEYNANINEIFKPNFESYGKIIVNDISFKMGEVPNKDAYYNAMLSAESQDEVEFINFLLHVHEFNGSDAFTVDSLIDYINEMDLDESEYVFTEWKKMMFKVNSINDVTCPHCGNVETYDFDDLPDFFPENWFIEE